MTAVQNDRHIGGILAQIRQPKAQLAIADVKDTVGATVMRHQGFIQAGRLIGGWRLAAMTTKIEENGWLFAVIRRWRMVGPPGLQRR